MNFKTWINEMSDPRKPTGSVKKRNFIKDPSTNTAHSVIEYHFKTKMGNVVKIHFQPKGDDVYDVIFYVNDTMDDESSQKDGSVRDAEILPGVLYVIQEKADKLKAKQITFRAVTGKNDTKTVKNADVTIPQKAVLKELNKFEAMLKNHPVKMIPPSPSRIALFQRLGKGIPQPLPDLDTAAILGHIEQLKARILEPTINVDEFLESFLRVDWKQFGINYQPLVTALRNLEGAWASHNEGGWKMERNRREAVYEKLVNRYFSKKWDVIKSGTFFTLSRKS